ncbi:hypothetical protein [Novosphingobium sp.]|uniref:hypothetical protein n=1 Tax=Novosphingobium sp. TaxID=1874826 RepID=UPI002B48FE53|nr:hypothetical protein [Novosphingobium sp.]HKR92417.1 hypothetical protein [Novosphingobium sp.]
MKQVALVILAAALIAAAPSPNRFGESCRGFEAIRIGNGQPRTLPYRLDFSVDLTLKSYCYAYCRPDQTYPVADPVSSPLKLADLDQGGEVRRIAFDRKTARLVDYQVFETPIGKIERRANADCVLTAFHSMEQAR